MSLSFVSFFSFNYVLWFKLLLEWVCHNWPIPPQSKLVLYLVHCVLSFLPFMHLVLLPKQRQHCSWFLGSGWSGQRNLFCVTTIDVCLLDFRRICFLLFPWGSSKWTWRQCLPAVSQTKSVFGEILKCTIQKETAGLMLEAGSRLSSTHSWL